MISVIRKHFFLIKSIKVFPGIIENHSQYRGYIMRKIIYLISLCMGLLFFSFSCARGAIETQGSENAINVVTTIYPLADIINELGGEKVNVVYLLQAGASPHTYEPTVEQARLVDEAQLFIYIGAGLDDWAVKLTEAAGSELVLLDLSKQVSLAEIISYRRLEDNDDQDYHHCEDNDSANAHEHHDCSNHHGPGDPHFWLDPLVVRDSICPAIYEKLILSAVLEEAYFIERLERYQAELTALHEEIEIATASFSGNRFISFHSAWQYFAHRYDLVEVAVIAEFPGQEPSAGWLAELIKLIERENIRAIFAEPQFSSTLAESIAKESGSEVYVLDPLGGEDLPDRESYLALMRFNLTVFQKALE
jgi:zinc transport system substrate-binding protein